MPSYPPYPLPVRVATFLALTISMFAAATTGAHAQDFRVTRSVEVTQPGSSVDATLTVPLGAAAAAEVLGLSVSDPTAPGLEFSAEVASAKTFPGRGQSHLRLDVEIRRADGHAVAAGRLQVAAELRTVGRGRQLAPRSGSPEPGTSVLAEGRIVKLSVDEDGVYAIDAAFLEELGFRPAEAPPSRVRLYSKGGRALPELVGAPYTPDLAEVALLELGDGDDEWDAGERLVFFGEGEDAWSYDADLEDFVRTENLYSEQTHYYLKVGGSGLRMTSLASITATAEDEVYTARARWEEDQVNLLDYSKQQYGAGQGSGQDWFGFTFGLLRELERDDVLALGDVVPGATGTLRGRFAASALSGGTRFRVSVDGETYESERLSSSVRRNANSAMASTAGLVAPTSLTSGNPRVSVAYPGSPEASVGWLDWLQVTHPARLRVPAGGWLRFSSLAHAAPGNYGYAVEAPADTRVLDVTDPLRPRVVEAAAAAGRLRFGYANAAEAPREFLAFAPSALRAPAVVGEVANTNLHAVDAAEMLIVYGEGLGDAAEKLAAHRRAFSGLLVETADVSAVCEEFGGGRPDPTAIRAFAHMVYSRHPDLRYLLLLGDGTFDPRDIRGYGGNLVPTYQTAASTWEVTAFPTDDYFGLLDEGEGRATTSYPRGVLDVAVGRIPANGLREAMAVVDKVIRYDRDPQTLGDWRTRTLFVGDDEDGARHTDDVDFIARNNRAQDSTLNQVKVYVDAFEQVATPGGTRIPRAAEAINQNMFRGNLVTTYLGHGGPRGWGQERFLNAPDIEGWSNPDVLPILVTATCTFTGFDDPELTVAGEQALLRRVGGSVATFSTTRPVYINDNKVLADVTHRVLLDREVADVYGVGWVLAEAKARASSSEQNERKYGLFGDPAMLLGRPRLGVAVTEVDGVAAGGADSATVQALRPFRVSGVVLERDGRMASDFDGELVVTVFDQDARFQTLGQDGTPVRTYGRQGGTLFKGTVTVTGGRWTAEIILPEDLSLARGAGRMSLYAKSEDGRDGAGAFEGFVIDGLAGPGQVDDGPPSVEVFLGDTDFEFGGTTHDDPLLVVLLADDTGLNVSGASIGHDLTATLVGESEASYVLNDFFTGARDDYRSGTVRYPLFDLPEGRYRVEVRAWDVANNPGTGFTEFVVSADAEDALERILAWPNPFAGATCFGFDHGLAGRQVRVEVDVFTSGGRLVRSLREERVLDGFRAGPDECIAWDGTGANGEPLPKGVYFFRVRVVAERGDGSERAAEGAVERVVLLR